MNGPLNMVAAAALMLVMNLWFSGWSLSRGERPLSWLALLTAAGLGTGLLAVLATTKTAAGTWFALAALVDAALPAGVLAVLLGDELPRWRIAMLCLAGGVGCVAVSHMVLRTPFTSSLGWLMAYGGLAPMVGIWLLLAYGLSAAMVVLRAPLPAWARWTLVGLLLPLLGKDVWPMLTHNAVYLAILPAWPTLVAGALGLSTTRQEVVPLVQVPALPQRPEPEEASYRPSTRERQSVAALKSSEERFRVLIEHASDSILILKADASIHYHSPSLRRMLSQYTTYMPGTSFLTFVHPDDQAAVSETLQELVVSHEKSVSIEFRMQRKREEWAYMQGRATNLLTHPDIEGIVLNLKDISHAKKLEDQLMQSQKMEALGRLAGGVAHDFNNLLTAIQGYTDILLRSVDHASEEFDYLQQIMQASERAAALTQQLLAFSRQKTMQQQKIMLNDILSGMKDMLKRIIGEDVELDMLLSVRAGFIMADPIQVQQIVMNLAVNARDAMPGGGLLAIETDGVTLSEGQHPGGVAGEYAILSVRDTGSGMTKDVEAHIFEPFFTTKGVGKGTGLGLSMVYGIVEQGGGHIEVDSVLQKGTTFRIFLPHTGGIESSQAPSQAEVPARPPPMPPIMPTRRETILVVEDADVIRRLAQRILSAKGYQVFVASNGAEALALAQEQRGHIHLMLTDVVMPNMNGVELASQMGVLRPDMKVLFMSGYVPEGSNRTPMQNTLQKPFTAESLVSKVREVLREEVGSASTTGQV